MQIIVIGNGFDLASGLPTSYIDYFNFFNVSNSTLISNLDDTIFNFVEKITSSLKSSNNNSVSPNSSIISNEKASDIYEKINESLAKPLQNYLDYVYNSSIIDEMIDKNISIWNLFFWFNGVNETKDYNWSSIEEQIALTLNFKDELSPLYFTGDNLVAMEESIQNIPSFATLNNKKDKEDYTPIKERKKVVGNLRTSDRLRVIILLLLKRRYGDSKIKDKFQIFKSELHLLEDYFKNYVKEVYESNVLNRSSSLVYRNNLSKLIDPLEEDCFIINFNYTDLSLRNTSSAFTFQKNKILYNVNQNNVHGVYYDKIILGIDQKGIPTTDPKYVFSKTYRKLETLFNTNSIGLPLKSKVSIISFYGHSFAQADYSYFRSIFDYYDLYNNSIKLKFYYSNYKKNDLARSKVTSGIFNLLESYAESMYFGNKQKGENLLHKLILENRIKVEEIDLKSVKSR